MIGASVSRRRAAHQAMIALDMRGREDSSELTERRFAFERLTDMRLHRAYRLAAVVLGNPSEAEDAVHDAAVIAWMRFDELRDRDRFEAWFDRIVVNECRQRLRRSPVRSLELAAPTGSVSSDGASDRAERAALRAALSQLKVEHRLVVVLRHLEGYSTAEIAARTGEREGTVKSRLHYALRELRAAYDAAERGGDR